MLVLVGAGIRTRWCINVKGGSGRSTGNVN